MKSCGILLLFIFTICKLKAQNVEVNYFAATVQSEKVLLVWEMAAGNTCNGIYIQRASSDLHFKEIGSIEGVCGNPTFASKYDYVDESPLVNQKSYYRIEFGGNGISDTVSVEVNALQGEPYLIKNNPLTENSLLLFENDNYQRVEFCVYDASGKLLYCFDTQKNNIELNRKNFQSGLYFFSLKSEGASKEIVGKFSVN